MLIEKPGFYGKLVRLVGTVLKIVSHGLALYVVRVELFKSVNILLECGSFMLLQ